jgi:hypothetical protein
MPRALWTHVRGRPVIQVALHFAAGNRTLPRTLLADTGAGSVQRALDLILEETDCRLCGGIPYSPVQLRGSYVGHFPSFAIRVQIPALGFDHYVRAAGVPNVPHGLDGIACFPFLNRFSYGNLADAARFGLEI